MRDGLLPRGLALDRRPLATADLDPARLGLVGLRDANLEHTVLKSALTESSVTPCGTPIVRESEPAYYF
jgi:hypothetical protein